MLTMPKLSVHLLGSFQVLLDGELLTGFATDKVRALLAYLAVDAARPHRREMLMGLLWPEYPQSKARQSLRQTLARLRQASGDDRESRTPFFLANRETLRLNPESEHWSDVATFTALVESCKGHQHRSLAGCFLCLQRMQEMVDLYRGDFLDEFFLEDSEPFEEWVLLTREWLHREVVLALAHLADYHERRGDCAQARAKTWRQIELDPWREESHRRLMRLLAVDGQRSAALAQYAACQRSLAEDLGVEPAESTTALYAQIRDAERFGLDFQSRRTPGPAPFHVELPAMHAPFVGRTAELTALAEKLCAPQCRLVTVVGSGGVGKTRLALRTAEDQVGLFDHGVAFVSLAAVSAPELLVLAIADALGFTMQGKQDPAAQLLERLSDVELLLVLDGFEHLLEGAVLLADILRHAPGVILLVTSRERLRLQEEWVYVLEGLTYPADELPVPENPDIFGALALFRQRATQADHRFTFSEKELPHIVRICRLVEGMPLGVELAAAWTPDYSCAEMAQAIAGNLDALTSPLRNVSARQRSVRATFEYSWNRLAAGERSAFEKLSVFRGGFSAAAARQVLGVSETQIRTLINKSLLREVSSSRYGIHELLRQFAAEKLVASQDERLWRDGHCAYYAAFLLARQEGLQKRRDRDVLEEIEREMGNIHLAWNWALAQARWENLAQSLASVWFYFLIRGPFQAGAALFERAAHRLRAWLEARSRPAPQAQLLLARLLVAQARFHTRLGLHVQAAEVAQAAAELAQQIAAPGVIAAAYVEWGEALWRQGAYEESRRKLARALEMAREAERVDIEAESLRHTGNTYLMVGSFEQALSYYRPAVQLCHEIGDRLGEAAALDNTACIATHLGRYDEARKYNEQTLSIYREIGDHLNEASGLVNLGELARLAGDFGRARVYYQESLTRFRSVGARSGEAIALSDLGMFLGYLGDHERAMDYCNQSLLIRRAAGDQRGEAIVLSALGLISHYRGDNEASLTYCRAALEIAESLGDRLRQSRTLTRMGHAWLGLVRNTADSRSRRESLVAATAAYRRVLAIRQEMGQTALPLEVTAGLASVSLEAGNLAPAQAHVEEILDSLNASTTEPGAGLAGAADPFCVYLICYQVLREAEDPRALDVLGTAHALLQKLAATIDDGRLRRSFLEVMPAHREIRDAWQRKDERA